MKRSSVILYLCLILVDVCMYESLSKVKLKYLRSLRLKKVRYKLQRYLVEGDKSVKDITKNGPEHLKKLYCTPEWLEENPRFAENHTQSIISATKVQLRSISHHKSIPSVIAECQFIPELNLDEINARLLVFCDDLQDPGNLGTLIRSCSWFGVDLLVLSNDTVDLYHPKVIQAAMGAILELKIITRELMDIIDLYDLKLHVADMNGEKLQELNDDRVILVVGNEGNGVKPFYKEKADKIVSIPAAEGSRVESLNASVAASIILSHYRR